MHALKKLNWTLTALVVTLMPGIALAKGLGEKTVMSMARRLWRDTLQPSLIPDTDYWFLFIGAMICIWALFAFFPRRIGEKELKIDTFLGHVGRVSIVLFAITMFFIMIWFAYGLIKGFLIGAIVGQLPNWEWLREAVTWILSIIITIFLVMGLFAMMRSIVETSKGAFAGIKAMWTKFDPDNPKNKKILGIFGMMLIHSILARMAYHMDILWPIITVSIIGVVATVYHFAFEKKVEDKIAIKKTGFTLDGKLLCEGTSMVLDEKTGKLKLTECGHKNEPGTKFCAKCGDPLGVGATWDCNKIKDKNGKNVGGCGKQNIPVRFRNKDEFCPECGTKRPPMPRSSLLPEDVKRFKKDKKLAKKGKRVCPHCSKENPSEFNICMHCDKQMIVTPSGAPLPPASLPTASPTVSVSSSKAIVPVSPSQLAQTPAKPQPAKRKVKGLSSSQRKKSVRSC